MKHISRGVSVCERWIGEELHLRIHVCVTYTQEINVSGLFSEHGKYVLLTQAEKCFVCHWNPHFHAFPYMKDIHLKK